MIASLASVLDWISHSRESIFYLTYKLENKSGSGSLIFAGVLVGMFDSPLLFSILMMLEEHFLLGSSLRNLESMEMTSLNGLIWAVFIGSLEIVYYRFGGRDAKIVDKFNGYSEVELKHSKTTGYWYAGVVFTTGMLLLIFL